MTGDKRVSRTQSSGGTFVMQGQTFALNDVGKGSSSGAFSSRRKNATRYGHGSQLTAANILPSKSDKGKAITELLEKKPVTPGSRALMQMLGKNVQQEGPIETLSTAQRTALRRSVGKGAVLHPQSRAVRTIVSTRPGVQSNTSNPGLGSSSQPLVGSTSLLGAKRRSSASRSSSLGPAEQKVVNNGKGLMIQPQLGRGFSSGGSVSLALTVDDEVDIAEEIASRKRRKALETLRKGGGLAPLDPNAPLKKSKTVVLPKTGK